MKCAIVVPAWLPEDIFSQKTAGSQINYWQPLGTLYVAASLLEAGHQVDFLNGAFLSHDQIMAQLAELKPEVVGLYSTTFGWDRAMKTAAAIKAFDPKIFVVVGGPYAVAVQEKCLEDCPDLDAVVTGEGEITMRELLAHLADQRPLLGLEGLVFRDNGKIVKNEPRPLITDLDRIPFPARELLGDSWRYIPPPATYRRKPVAVIMTSRGCNRKCLYCFQIDKYRKSGIRYRSIENVMAEIELVLAQGYREIKFIDDTLAADYERAMAIANEIKRRKLDFTWFVSACVNQVDKKLLTAFKEAGCWAILFGAESGVQKNLNSIRKGITVGQIEKAVKAAKEVGLFVYTPFLFGIPDQTFEDGLKTIEFACRLDPDIANFHAITPFPGTELYDNLEKYGTMSKELSDFTYQGAAFVPFTMTREEIQTLRQLAFRKFYGRPSYMFKRFLKLRNANDIRAAVLGLKSLLWLWLKRGIFHRYDGSGEG
ncbi:MAG: B12-binding domain-containing radical SAM protein [Proteobacteria bacterium]|nr:B12-binding domain-containing radical SAM protein [Pseudomonadota bacterium]MBU1714070.1 B12-binding domain-containing radical SAM protein [Pseudomonadota bacterium]